MSGGHPPAFLPSFTNECMELHCTHLNQRGRLLLTDSLIRFETYESLECLFECSWLELDKDSYAPDSDPRAMARLSLKGGGKHFVFNLSSKEDSNRLKKYCKQRKQQQLASEVKASHQGVTIEQIRSDMLQRDDSLQQQFTELVDSGILTESEFWNSVGSSRQLLLDQRESESLNVRGTLSTLLSDSAQEGDDLTNSAEKKAHIFSLYPAVRDAFVELVPQQMEENVFWSKYLKSDYFQKV